MRTIACLLLLTPVLSLCVATPASAQEEAATAEELSNPERLQKMLDSMNGPFPPFKVIGNIYFVGTNKLSCFLITTPKGHFLLDSGFEQSVPMIRDNIRNLGFKFEDIKYLLNSHAHLDHSGGHSQIKELTGAQILMSERDAELLANGGKGDFNRMPEELLSYSPAKADRILHDGDTVELGGVTMTARMTPGHTKGCTSWTMSVEDQGQHYDVVFYGSTNLLGVGVVNNPKYPKRDEDFLKTFRTLKSLSCDVFLGAHGSFYGMEPKYERLMKGEQPNPFIDPEGYQRYVSGAERKFLKTLEEEKAAAAAETTQP